MSSRAASIAMARRQAVLASLMPVFVTAAIVGLIVYVLTAIATWNMLVKAGEKGWKGLIPFYNIYMLFKISWQVKWFWICLGISVVALILGNISISGNQVLFVFVCILCILLAVALVVLNCILMLKISVAFGKDGAFAVGLILLNVVFMLILGFGSAKYEGAYEAEPSKSDDQSKMISFSKAKKLVEDKKENLQKKTTQKKPTARKKSKPKKAVSKEANASAEKPKSHAKPKVASKPAEKAEPKKKIPDYIDAKQRIDF